MIDRGIIKWQPFDSCYSSEKVLYDIQKQKSRKVFPVLSEDQLYILEERLFDAYHLNIEINIEYFYNGKINQIKGKIETINSLDKKIYVKKHIIYFKQIINVF